MKIFTLLLILFFSGSVFADLAVIVHKSNTDEIDRKTVERIYLGKIKRFPSGEEVVTLSLKDSARMGEFTQLLLNRSSSQYKSYWSKLIFTGKGIPPRESETNNDIIALVVKNPNTIGFIDTEAVSDDVRVLFILNK